MYTEHAAAYAKAIEANAFNAGYERPTMLALLPDVTGKKVLDLGCGPGIYGEALLKLGADLCCIDQSDEMVELTRERLKKLDSGTLSNVYSSDLGLGLSQELDGHYDVVICPLMLHYLEDWTVLLAEVHRVLVGGGVFLFSTHHPMVDYGSSPSGDYFKVEKIVEDWDTIEVPVTVSFYRRPLQLVFSALDAAGFQVNKFSEGRPATALAEAKPDVYKRLSERPGFIFFGCSAR